MIIIDTNLHFRVCSATGQTVGWFKRIKYTKLICVGDADRAFVWNGTQVFVGHRLTPDHTVDLVPYPTATKYIDAVVVIGQSMYIAGGSSDVGVTTVECVGGDTKTMDRCVVVDRIEGVDTVISNGRAFTLQSKASSPPGPALPEQQQHHTQPCRARGGCGEAEAVVPIPETRSSSPPEP